MNGVASLMQGPQGQQGPMPGQAPQQMPGMMPQQGAPTPGAMTGSLKNMPLEQLRMLYQNPQPGSPPLWAVISALAEKQKEAQAMQMAQGQQAMAQNQQMQQQPPVAAQVMQSAEQMQQPVMAAYGGEMQGYAGGGAVAFNRGGNVQYFNKGADENGVQSFMERLPKDSGARRLYEWIKAGRPSLEKPILDALLQKEQQVAAPTTEGAPAAALTAATQMTPQQRERFSPPETVAAPPGAAPRPGPGAGNRPVVAAAPPPAVPTQGLQNLVDLDKAQKEELAVIQGRQAVDPTVLAARKAEREGAEGIATGRQTRSQAQLTEAQRLRDEALQRSQGNIFSDPEALLRIASGIDTRKGRGIGSLAGGVADIMGQRRSEAAAARKDFQTAQNLHNQELNALDTLRQLQRERDTAIAAGDVTAARAIQDQITSVNRFYQKAKEDRQTAERNYQLDVLKTQATRDQAQAAMISAGKPSEFDVAMNRPEEYKRILEARASAQQLKKSPEEVRAAAMERYADNWEKLDPMQKGDLAKQGITNFQQYVRMRDQMASLGGAATGAPTQLPPAALSQLKEGVATTFANGQQWTLKNGQPTQVK